MGKKDAKQEHYQVEEKAQDELRYTKQSVSSDESVECGVRSAEWAGRREWSFLFERVLKTWSWEGNLLFFVW